MKKLFVLLFLLLMVGCSKSSFEVELEKKVEKNHYKVIKIDINLLNEQTDEYYVFLVKPGQIGKNGAITNTSDSYGPIEVENFKAEIDFSKDSGVEFLLEELIEKKLQLVVTTREDYLIRNPLNEETFVHFETEEDYYWPKYLATQEKFSVDIMDKYPDGVLSLPWPKADFVVKLKFKEGVEPYNSYSVCLRQIDLTRPSGISMVCLGSPLSNKTNYYNAVFYKESFMNYVGQIEIVKNQTQRVRYENEPIKVQFDREGKPIGNNVVEVLISE